VLFRAQDGKGVSGLIRALQSPLGATAFEALNGLFALFKISPRVAAYLLEPSFGKGNYKGDLHDEFLVELLSLRGRPLNAEQGPLRSQQVIEPGENESDDDPVAWYRAALDPDYGEVGLKRAIAMNNAGSIKAYLQLLIVVQSGESGFGKQKALLNAIRGSHETRFLGCCVSNTSEYKRLIQTDHTLHDLFQQAERSLKF
jgi:hypothetical protein